MDLGDARPGRRQIGSRARFANVAESVKAGATPPTGGAPLARGLAPSPRDRATG